ncbi:MAG TPA: hypothetical protein ENJ16_01510 [Planctomycetaceae bacterium]|nr:hypothetical protein [Planctomycetaceae bacterium]
MRFSARSFLFLCLIAAPTAIAQTPPASPSPTTEEKTAEHFEAFAQSLHGVRLRGHFTVVDEGKITSQHEEQYEIREIQKLPQGDRWRFLARIRYGRIDVTLPLVLQVKWADTTPVITLDSVRIPGLGTFSARVLFHGQRYAGTWQHGDKGGHLYGVIEKLDGTKDTPSSVPTQQEGGRKG